MYVYFKSANLEMLDRRQFDYLTNLFKIANEIIGLYGTTQEHSGTRFRTDLCRFMVSELNIWRYGFRSLNSKIFKNLLNDRNKMSAELVAAFDVRFGEVRACRNILQHYEKYIFGEQASANIRQKEFDKIDAPITLSGAKVSQFQACFVGERFCASHINGTIHSVYIGKETPRHVVDLLELLTVYLCKNGAFQIELEAIPEISVFDKRIGEMREKTKALTAGSRFISCLFSTKTDIEAPENDDPQMKDKP